MSAVYPHKTFGTRVGPLISKSEEKHTGYNLDNIDERHDMSPEDCAECDGEDDEGPVPLVVVVDGGHAKEHEDDRLGRTVHMQGSE